MGGREGDRFVSVISHRSVFGIVCFILFHFFVFFWYHKFQDLLGPLHHVKSFQLSVFRLALLVACFKVSKRILEPLCFICSFFGGLENGWEGFLNLHFYQAEKVEHSWAADLTIKGQRLFVWKFQKKFKPWTWKCFLKHFKREIESEPFNLAALQTKISGEMVKIILNQSINVHKFQDFSTQKKGTKI